MHQSINEAIDQYGISTSTIADVLDAFGISGCLSHELTPVTPGKGLFFGRAYTVKWRPVRKGKSITQAQPSTWNQVRNFLVPELPTGKGLVYVAGAGPLVRDAALAGGISATYFHRQLQFEGMVLGGAVRDMDSIDGLGLPVVASNSSPTDTQGSYRVSEVGTECTIDNVIVRTGDWIFSDNNGTVVVPADRMDQILDEAVAVEQAESRILAEMDRGTPLHHLIDEMGRI
jgi:regulator of RNase E activity RraA